MREHELKMFLKKCDGDDVPTLVNEICRLNKIINPTAKRPPLVTDEQVAEMRDMYKNQFRVKQIADKYGVSYGYVYTVVTNAIRRYV